MPRQRVRKTKIYSWWHTPFLYLYNSVNYENGHKLQWSKHDLKDLKERCNEQSREQGLTVESGDTISANIVVDKGSLSIKIQKDGEEPIYESDGISASNEFDVEIDESGTYTVEVTGKKAKGSVSFTVVTNQ